MFVSPLACICVSANSVSRYSLNATIHPWTLRLSNIVNRPTRNTQIPRVVEPLPLSPELVRRKKEADSRGCDVQRGHEASGRNLAKWVSGMDAGMGFEY